MDTIADVGCRDSRRGWRRAPAADGGGRSKAADHRGELCGRRIRCGGGAPLWFELQYAVHLGTARTGRQRRRQDSEHCAGEGRGGYADCDRHSSGLDGSDGDSAWRGRAGPCRGGRRCDGTGSDRQGARAMIPIPSGARVWLVARHPAMRKGFDGLALIVQETLRRDPHSGHLFVFRGRRGSLIKCLWSDGQGLCLFSKRLERGRFLWPSLADGTVTISTAQLSYLLSGIDWRMPQETWRPTAVG